MNQFTLVLKNYGQTSILDIIDSWIKTLCIVTLLSRIQHWVRNVSAYRVLRFLLLQKSTK